jgi:peptidoglycan/LPS O-acetylase OafA/YrhL
LATARIEARPRSVLAFSRLLAWLTPGSGATQEIAPVDGLRAVAILLVIWCHLSVFGAYFHLNVGPAPIRLLGDFGFAGVLLFFVLSGFLLFLPYARALVDQRPWPSAHKFHLRRALRILPLYDVALAILLIPGGWLRPQNAGALVFITLLLHDTRPDSAAVISLADAPLWTLAVEWQFYLLLPWLALALAKVAGAPGNRWFFLRLAGGLAALVALGLGVRWLAASIYYDGGQIQPINSPGMAGAAMMFAYGIKGKYLEVFALGMAASLLYVLAVERGGLSVRHRKRLGTLAALAAGSGFVGCLLWATLAQRIPYTAQTAFAWIFVPPPGRLWEILGEWALGLCFALLLLGILFGAPTLQRLFSFAPLRVIGIISYSLYIWHYPILTVLSRTIQPSLPAPYLRFIILACSIVFLVCFGSYVLIERPFARYRRATYISAKQGEHHLDTTRRLR